MVYHFGDGNGRRMIKMEELLKDFYPSRSKINDIIGTHSTDCYRRTDSRPDWSNKSL